MKRKGDREQLDGGGSDFGRIIRAGCLMPLAALSLMSCMLFSPLIFSLIENSLLGTDHIYEFFDTINLADPLGEIYQPVYSTFEWFINLFL